MVKWKNGPDFNTFLTVITHHNNILSGKCGPVVSGFGWMSVIEKIFSFQHFNCHNGKTAGNCYDIWIALEKLGGTCLFRFSLSLILMIILTII